MSGCVCIKDDVDQWLLTRTGLLEGDPDCPIHGKGQAEPAAPDLTAKAWSETRIEVVRSLRASAANHEAVASLGGQDPEHIRQRLAEMGQSTYAQQAIAERALADQVEALTVPVMTHPPA